MKWQVESLFPSPHWGLFFYQYVTRVNRRTKWIPSVSVPVLGIIFLSYITILLTATAIPLNFRPRTGDYFFIQFHFDNEKNLFDIGSFRPRTGDYFLSRERQIIVDELLELVFPSPHWGLFFYRQSNALLIKQLVKICFRPHTGDYVFIKSHRGCIWP